MRDSQPKKPFVAEKLNLWIAVVYLTLFIHNCQNVQ